MFIRRKDYDELVKRAHAAEESTKILLGVDSVLRAQVAASNTTIDWFRVRISQLEMERAQMLYNYTGVKISTPTIERVPEVDTARILQSMPSFDDVGDREAIKMGLGWNADGTFKTVTE